MLFLKKDICDKITRSKMIVTLALLASSNTDCARSLYHILDVDICQAIDKMKAGAYLDEKIADEFLLMLTMAANHPAFDFGMKTNMSRLYICAEQKFKLDRVTLKESNSDLCLCDKTGGACHSGSTRLLKTPLPGEKGEDENENNGLDDEDEEERDGDEEEEEEDDDDDDDGHFGQLLNQEDNTTLTSATVNNTNTVVDNNNNRNDEEAAFLSVDNEVSSNEITKMVKQPRFRTSSSSSSSSTSSSSSSPLSSASSLLNQDNKYESNNEDELAHVSSGEKQLDKVKSAEEETDSDRTVIESINFEGVSSIKGTDNYRFLIKVGKIHRNLEEKRVGLKFKRKI